MLGFKSMKNVGSYEVSRFTANFARSSRMTPSATITTSINGQEPSRRRYHRFIDFFVNKVRLVKQAVSEKVNGFIGGRTDPLYRDNVHSGPTLSDLNPLSVDEARRCLVQSQLNPPTWTPYRHRC